MMRIITPRRISWIGPIVIDLHVRDLSIDERRGMGKEWVRLIIMGMKVA